MERALIPYFTHSIDAKTNCIEAVYKNDSPLQYQVILGAEQDLSSSAAYIGLRKDGRDPNSEEFQWSDSTVLDFENWDEDQPENLEGQEGCVLLQPKNGIYLAVI